MKVNIKRPETVELGITLTRDEVVALKMSEFRTSTDTNTGDTVITMRATAALGQLITEIQTQIRILP